MNKREILAIDAAKLYYLEGWSQARIAKERDEYEWHH